MFGIGLTTQRIKLSSIEIHQSNPTKMTTGQFSTVHELIKIKHEVIGSRVARSTPHFWLLTLGCHAGATGDLRPAEHLADRSTHQESSTYKAL